MRLGIWILSYLDSVFEKKNDSSKKKIRNNNHIPANISILNRTLLKKQSILSENIYVLGRKDSNLRIAGPKPVALPLGHAPFRFLCDTNKVYCWFCLFVNSSPNIYRID